MRRSPSVVSLSGKLTRSLSFSQAHISSHCQRTTLSCSSSAAVYQQRRSVRVQRPLSERNPKVAAELHPTKNGEITAGHIIPVEKKVWFLCPNGHEYQAKLCNRLYANSGCKLCRIKYLLREKNPELYVQLHPTKNNVVVEHLSAHGRKKVWWQCPESEEHIWDATPHSRSVMKTGCPFCFRGGQYKRLSRDNSLLGRYPEVAAEWHPTKNGDKGPEDVFPRGRDTAWWKCKRMGHEWKGPVRARITRFGYTMCPKCVNEVQYDSIISRSRRVASQFDTVKNKCLPSHVAHDDEASYHWRCGIHGPYEATPVSIFIPEEENKPLGGCPQCSRDEQLSTPSVSMQSLYPELSAELIRSYTKSGEKYTFDPAEILPAGTNKLPWRCSKFPDEHAWEAKVYNRVFRRNGCPYCAGARVSATNSLASLYPEIAAEFHPTMNLIQKSPNEEPVRAHAGDYTHKSRQKVWWKCSKNPDHVFKACIANRTSDSQPTGCPLCYAANYSVFAKYPELAELWHKTKNKGVEPEDVRMSTHIKYFWEDGTFLSPSEKLRQITVDVP